MKKLCFCLFTIIVPLHGWFGYDRAVSAAQQEQWQQANEQFKQLITQRPDRPGMLYDAGVAAYNVEDFGQAHAYFQAAAEHETADRRIKERGYFNAGNARVQLKKLKEALMHYDQALMLNPENEQAQHNRDVVRRMLDQQEQQQQQNDQQDKQKEDKQDEKKDEKETEQDKDNNCQSDESSKGGDQEQEQSSSSGKNSDETGADQDEQKGEQQEGDKELGDQGDQKDDEQERADEQQRERDQDQQGDANDDFDQEPQADEQREQEKQQPEHQPSSEEQFEQQEAAQSQDTQAEQKEQEGDQQEAQPLQPVELDPRLERVLAQRADRDAELNKQMIKAQVSKDMAGQYGQNCW